jgi:hypothetical protein
MIEPVLDDDGVSRLIFRPRDYDDDNKLVWPVIFEFAHSRCESAVWRKYAPADEDVHRIGNRVEQEKKSRRPSTFYVGFISANVCRIRSIETARGHGFSVVHDPSHGQGLHHVHICYRPQGDQDPGVLTKNDKNELKMLLRNIFDEEMTAR